MLYAVLSDHSLFHWQVAQHADAQRAQSQSSAPSHMGVPLQQGAVPSQSQLTRPSTPGGVPAVPNGQGALAAHSGSTVPPGKLPTMYCAL